MEFATPAGPEASLAERLAPLGAVDPEGREIRFGDLWRERPIVLVFLRHFG